MFANCECLHLQMFFFFSSIIFITIPLPFRSILVSAKNFVDILLPRKSVFSAYIRKIEYLREKKRIL